MAKNREPEKPIESESESGEDDDEVSSEEVGSSDSDSEPEPEQTLAQSTKNPSTAPGPKKPQPQPSLKPPPPQPSSSSEEEEEGSGSEPESDTEPVDQNVKPLVSKPMDVPQKPTTSAAARKPRSKPNASQPSTPSKATGAKRPAEEKEAEAKDNKRSKKKPPYEAESSGKPPSTPNDDPKKQLFQRLWSEDDEIVVLKGLIDYATKKKADPFTDLSDFHDFIRENLHVDVTRTQLQDKIRRLRKKYQNNRSKEKKGKERTFSKAHERNAYDLSNMIWGPGGSGNDNGSEGDKAVGSPKANGTAVRKTPSEGVNKVENSNSKEMKSLAVANGDVEMMTGSFGGMSMREWILRTGAELFEGEKRFEGHKEWRKLRVEEIELEEKRYDLMRAQTKLVLNILRSTEH